MSKMTDLEKFYDRVKAICEALKVTFIQGFLLDKENRKIGQIKSISVEGGDCRPYNELSVNYQLQETDYTYQGNVCKNYFSEQLDQFAEQFMLQLIEITE